MPSLDPPGGVIPISESELTPTWLAAIFTRNGYSAAIEAIDFRPLEAMPLTSHIRRVIPRVQDETTGFAPPLIWKRSLDDLNAREAFRRGYAAEVTFYRDIAPGLGLSIPRCFAAAHDETTGDHVLLLAEAAGTPGDLAAGVSPERAEAVLAELARVHAARWNLHPVPRPAEGFARLEALVERHAPQSTPFLEQHVDSKAAARTRRYASEVASLFAALSASPQTLVHGDAHPGNVILPERSDARPVLLDWQGCGTDSPMRDLARFLVLGLTTEDRRASEAVLLDSYLEQLAGHGVDYDRTEAGRAYRLASVLQWGWAVIFFRHEQLWDPDTRAAMPALVRRAAAAFDDSIDFTDQA